MLQVHAALPSVCALIARRDPATLTVAAHAWGCISLEMACSHAINYRGLLSTREQCVASFTGGDHENEGGS